MRGFYFHISGYTSDDSSLAVLAAIPASLIIVLGIVLFVHVYKKRIDRGISENTALHTRIKQGNNPQYSTLKQEEANV